MARIEVFQASLVLGLAAVVGCRDLPVTPPSSSALTGPPRRLTLDELYLEIAKSAPGFAGVFRDSTGGLVIQLTNEADEARASEALAAAPEFSRLGSLPRRTARVSFDFPTLHAAARAVARSLDLAGVALIDADEFRNRVVVGTVDAEAAA
jgi:hypothetical protein